MPSVWNTQHKFQQTQIFSAQFIESINRWPWILFFSLVNIYWIFLIFCSICFNFYKFVWIFAKTVFRVCVKGLELYIWVGKIVNLTDPFKIKYQSVSKFSLIWIIIQHLNQFVDCSFNERWRFRALFMEHFNQFVHRSWNIWIS